MPKIKDDNHFIIDRIQSDSAFTLIEVLLAVVFLGLLATATSSVYSTGFQSMDAQIERTLLDSKLRSRMEVLTGTTFSALAGGTEAVTVNGSSYTIDWTVATTDLNGDAVAEPSAKIVTVSVAGMTDRSLVTLVVDHENIIGKIP